MVVCCGVWLCVVVVFPRVRRVHAVCLCLCFVCVHGVCLCCCDVCVVYLCKVCVCVGRCGLSHCVFCVVYSTGGVGVLCISTF